MISTVIIPTLGTALISLAYCFIFIYIPGYLLTRSLKLSPLVKFAVAATVGISLYGFTVHLVRLIHAPYWITELIFLLPIIWLRRNLRFNFKLSRFELFFMFLALLIALVHSAVLITSYLPNTSGVLFTQLSFHDTMQHISIIDRLYSNFTITQPGYSSALLTNYHYLIDQIIAAITRFPAINLFHFYYRVYPLSISIIFSLTLLGVFQQLTKSKPVYIFGTIFTFFAGNASYFFHFFRGPEYSWGANAFMINPIIDILQNPASIFVLAQMLTVFVLLKHFELHRHLTKSNTLLLAISIIAGTMIGFKAWGGLLIVFSLAVITTYSLIFNKQIFPLLILISTLFISAIIFLPHYQPDQASSPVWSPGWTLERMVNDQDRWNELEDIFKREHYLYTNNTPRLILMYAKWTFLYIFGNYWLRLVGLIAITSWIVFFKKLTLSRIFIISTVIPSLVIPLLFNQGRMAYDIEQFSPYALVFSSIFSFIFIHFLLKKFNLTPLVMPVLFILTLISFPSNLTSLKARIFNQKTLITTDELNAYDQVRAITAPSAVILLSPEHRNIATLEFAALSGRDTYYSGRTLSVITGTDYESRKKTLDSIFYSNNQHLLSQVIEENDIDYIFLYKEDIERSKADFSNYSLIYSNPDASLYEIN